MGRSATDYPMRVITLSIVRGFETSSTAVSLFSSNMELPKVYPNLIPRVYPLSILDSESVSRNVDWFL